jgi:Protein of unknown function (DUF2927)
MMPSRTRPNIAFMKSVVACVLAVTAMTVSAEQRTGIAGSSRVQRTAFSDAEITDGFFKIALGAELDLAGSAERIRKFDGPVRVAVESRAKPDRRSQVADVVRDIRKLVRHLDIAMVDSSSEANVAVKLVRDRDRTRAIVRLYGRERTRQIQRSLAPQCLSSFSRNDTFRITRSNVLIVADAGSFIFYDCIYEELLQALGPINDTKTVPWTMFNDDVRMGFFGVYDQYILNILYDPRIRPGMKPDEVRAVLPQVLPAVKAWVTRINNLEP